MDLHINGQPIWSRSVIWWCCCSSLFLSLSLMLLSLQPLRAPLQAIELHCVYVQRLDYTHSGCCKRSWVRLKTGRSVLIQIAWIYITPSERRIRTLKLFSQDWVVWLHALHAALSQTQIYHPLYICAYMG